MINKILITGGAGFIGSNVARRLITLGKTVTILDNFNPQIHGGVTDLAQDLQGKVRLIRGDVADKAVFDESLKGQDAVIHLAAETGTGQSMYDIARYTQVNIQATSYLCDFIVNEEHQLKTVVVASSRAIYGEGKYLTVSGEAVYPSARTAASVNTSFEVANPLTGKHDLTLCATDESSKIHPSSYYGITKQVQEQMVILAARLKNINGFAFRYQNVYGPGQSLKNPYTGILSIFSRLALKGEEINIFEDGKESRDFVFIDDVVEATVRSLDQSLKGQYILNVGSGVPVSVHQVAEEIVTYLKSKSRLTVSGAFREGDIRHNYADLTQVQAVLGFKPQIAFKDGLHRFLDWVLSQKDIPATMNDYKKSLDELSARGLYQGKQAHE